MGCFDGADQRRVAADDRVVGKLSCGAALAIVPPGGMVHSAESFLVFGSSFRTAQAGDPAGWSRVRRPGDQPAAVRRIFARSTGGFVVNVHLAVFAVSQSDCGGGEQKRRPLSQFFALAPSSSNRVTVLWIASKTGGSSAATASP